VTPGLLVPNAKRMKKDNLRRRRRSKNVSVENRECAEMVNAGALLVGKEPLAMSPAS
jgi:hypothetical protein